MYINIVLKHIKPAEVLGYCCVVTHIEACKWRTESKVKLKEKSGVTQPKALLFEAKEGCL